MFKVVQLFICLVAIVLLQVSLFPTYLENAFKPNLMLILVCFLALRGSNTVASATVAYFAGLLQGVFSGLNFGLAGISSLLIYLFLRKISDQLYTESHQLLVFAVFVSSLVDPLISMVLITLLSSNSGVYGSIFVNMVPQALMTALIAAIAFPAYVFIMRRSAS